MVLTELLGVSEAAKLIGCSERTVKRLAKTGELPHALKMPGQTGAYLFHRNDVEALAKGRAA
jgi:excisionase family DNA binding protein